MLIVKFIEVKAYSSKEKRSQINWPFFSNDWGERNKLKPKPGEKMKESLEHKLEQKLMKYKTEKQKINQKLVLCREFCK